MRKSYWQRKLFEFSGSEFPTKSTTDPATKVLNWLKVYYHRHITYEPRIVRARKGIKSLCAVKC
ncbi:hypothetical protein CWS02_06595 [Enterobacter sp. EA-1]|nr:hypothetical protein CWS02_06595 [Enterobacter sp. EA-1]